LLLLVLLVSTMPGLLPLPLMGPPPPPPPPLLVVLLLPPWPLPGDCISPAAAAGSSTLRSMVDPS
jgi:hypothetical protein